MKLLTILAGIVLLALFVWVFFIVTYPIARRLGIFGGKKDAESSVDNRRDPDVGLRL